jgi:uncharacterized protein (DUF1501 family)
MPLSRRLFLRNGIVTLAAVGAGPTLSRGSSPGRRLPRRPGRRKRPGRKVLVCVFQRGAADGLSMVAPFGDPTTTSSARRSPSRPPRRATARGTARPPPWTSTGTSACTRGSTR